MQDYSRFFNLPQDTHPERLWVIDQLSPQDKVLDVGCGTHKTVSQAVGVDIRPVTDIQASADSLPFENKQFDVLIARHCLEHMLDPIKTLKEWERVAKKLIIILPDHSKVDTMSYELGAGQHLHAYTPESFDSLMSVFDTMLIEKRDTVIEGWSFGAVISTLTRS